MFILLGCLHICLYSFTKSCPTLCDLMDCSPPGSSAQGILQARILEWVAISFSTGFFWPRDQTSVSCIAGRLFIVRATRKVPEYMSDCPQKWKNRIQGSGKFLRHFPEMLQKRISWGEKLTSLVPPGTNAEAAYWWPIPNDASSIFLLKILV